MYRTPASLPIWSRTLLGNTSDPKIAGTLSRFSWRMIWATSCGRGSEKLEGSIAPITRKP